MPAKGISLHIGLNSVDPAHYGGWDGQLMACEADAKDMAAIAKSQGFASRSLMMSQVATSKAVIAAIRSAAKSLKKGDLFLLTYSGHGGQVPDTNDEEPDGQDETWLLYDRQLVDDELYALWAKFVAGVRIAMLSDSCHSGSVSRAMPTYLQLAGKSPLPRFRVMPEAVRKRTYLQNKSLYDGIQKAHPRGDTVKIGASVILISGCQDNQTSADGDRNGLFTEKLRKKWNNGKFSGGGYRIFRQQIAALLPPTQSPRYSLVGSPNPAFERQKPFTI